jgi:YHS domain-containing protein
MKYTIGFLLIVMCMNPSKAQIVFATSGVAINGYDPVAYFEAGKPVKGTNEFQYEWNGARWQFSSQQNLDSFKVDPEKFAPQFGGYCAFGMAENHKATTSPEAWTIVDGKLYLNYNDHVRKLWRENQNENIDLANTNWPHVQLEKD